MSLFHDRPDAGRRLGAALLTWGLDHPIQVVTLGGPSLQVAYEVARALGGELDLFAPGEAAKPLAGRIAILVDDGLSTMPDLRAAIDALKDRGPAQLIVAMPAASHARCLELIGDTPADDVLCIGRPNELEIEADLYEISAAESRSQA